MWTDEEIQQHVVYLTQQEELVLAALDLGITSPKEIERFVISVMGDCDHAFVKSIITQKTVSDGKIPLEAL